MKPRTLWIGMTCLAICGLTGCAGDAPTPEAEPPAAVEAEAAAPVEVGPEVTAVLAKADLADGVEDQVVSQCPGCGLAMEGSSDHAMQVGDYALHFCSDSCQGRFEKNPAESILALGKLGEEAEAEEATP